MDEARARRITAELLNKEVGGWLLERYIDAGKSALVFAGSRAGQLGAVKIFDPELIDRVTREVQQERIARERSLIGTEHRNLVRILDGGECTQSGYFYVVMELLDGCGPLSRKVGDVPRDKIRPTISAIAAAARYLLDHHGFAHRDIKPSNITVTDDFSSVILLDLGVLRPVGESEITDQGDSRPFIGTHRYSPPEFILRSEDQTPAGFLALTFYQLGAVLHDLIVGRKLFGQYDEPPARLSQAILSEIPVVESDEAPPDLVQLARNCLVKEPSLRLQLVRWEHFEEGYQPTQSTDDIEQRIRARIASAGERATRVRDDEAKRRRRIAELTSQVEELVRQECTSNRVFPPVTLERLDGTSASTLTVSIEPSPDFSLSSKLFILLNFELIDEPGSVIRLTCNASLGIEARGDSKPFFMGVFALDVLQPRIRRVLMCAFDAAQTTPPPPPGEGKPIPSELLQGDL